MTFLIYILITPTIWSLTFHMAELAKGLKNNAVNIFLIFIGIVTIGISGFFYYTTTIYTSKAYDTKLIEKRNEMVLTVDDLTTCFATPEQTVDCNSKISQLEEQNKAFSSLIDQTKVPKGRDDLKEANRDFSTKTGTLIQNAKAYQQSFDDDSKDVKTIISNYNQSVTDLDTQIKTIAELVRH